MSHELRITSRAEADIADAFDWYEQRVPGLGVDFLHCVDATISSVQRSPQFFRPRHSSHRLAMTPRFPYAVYFICNEFTGLVSIRPVLGFAQNAPAYLEQP
ncbi:MAG: type II toxin-antitoxin system RelE/ParE family toxin [Undibacterium sp.]|nr:type II toxin-antitoxin system RelE/ParE family toxin [Opitutaceae bacterium]